MGETGARAAAGRRSERAKLNRMRRELRYQPQLASTEFMKPARRLFEQPQRALEDVERHLSVERRIARGPEFGNSTVLLDDETFAPTHVLRRLRQQVIIGHHRRLSPSAFPPNQRSKLAE